MKKTLTAILMLLLVFGCAPKGPKYVDLFYTGTSDVSGSGKVGIATFKDERENVKPGYVGTRYIGSRGKEIYMALGDDLGLSVTTICRSYLQASGFDCVSVPPWEYTPEGAKAAGQRFDYLVGGEIKKLECFAVKKIGFTSMTLDIDIVFYIGNPDKGVLKTAPVKLKLERNEIIFSEEKLQKFLNDSLLEIIQSALKLQS